MKVQGSVRNRPRAAVALDDLEELGEQEERSEDAEVHGERDDVGDAEGARAEEAQREHRLGRARSQARNAASSSAPAASEPSTVGLVQPSSSPRTMPHTARAGRRWRGRRRAGRASAPGPWLSVNGAGRAAQRDADRHVDPEDPVPRDAVDDRTADQRSERDAEAGDAGPGAERQPAQLGPGTPWASRVSDSGTTSGGAEALHGTHRDQRARSWARGGGRRGEGEEE